MVWTATVSSKGQMTIPKPVRDALGLEAGVEVLVTLHEGKAELAPISGDVRRWRGALRSAGAAGSPEEVRERVRRAIAEETIREMQGD
jgi:AbrB family looped-hinge helix DNA binding protein